MGGRKKNQIELPPVEPAEADDDDEQDDVRDEGDECEGGDVCEDGEVAESEPPSAADTATDTVHSALATTCLPCELMPLVASFLRTHHKPRKCKLCGHCSLDANPLRPPPGQNDAATENPCNPNFGEFRPWRSYTARRGFREPDGRFCAICVDVFRALGYDVKHGTLTEYLKWVSADVQRHHDFMASVKHWIEKHNSGKLTLRDVSPVRLS